jgi:hypothetical protein
LQCCLLQVIDEYDEESEVAERLRIRVIFSDNNFSVQSYLKFSEFGIEDKLCYAFLDLF